MVNEKTIVIIGAGISGLTAGIYAEQHGFHVIILEKNPSVGGLCTGWYRKGFYLDGCVHWLTGTKEGTLLNEMWHNIGAFANKGDILYLPNWGSFEYQGQVVTFWRDLDRAQKEWTEISPVDAKMIKKFFKMVRDFSTVELPLDLPFSMMPLKRKIQLGFRVLKVWPSYLRTMFQTSEKFAKKFKSPAIRNALTTCQTGGGNLFSMIYSYSTVVIGDGGVPKGASKPMVERMKEKFISLGGTLKLNAEVDEIIVKDKIATGVRLKNGDRYIGDYVVSCLDTHHTLTNLLKNKYSLPEFERRFADPIRNPSPSCILINYAVKKDNDLPSSYSFDCKSFTVAGHKISYITVRNYGYDDSFTRGDKTVLSVLIHQTNADYPFYKKLYENKEDYKQFKNWVAKQVQDRIAKRFPELKDSLEVLDVATPCTFNRYVNSSNGVFMSFFFTNKDFMFSHHGKLRGIKNFYLSSQWMQGPGGLPIAMTQGKFAIQRICKREKLSYIFSPTFIKKKKFMY